MRRKSVVGKCVEKVLKRKIASTKFKNGELRRQSLKTENCVDKVEKRKCASKNCVLTETKLCVEKKILVFGPDLTEKCVVKVKRAKEGVSISAHKKAKSSTQENKNGNIQG